MEINNPANTQITDILTASIAAVILIIFIVIIVLIIVLMGLFFRWKSRNIIKLKSNNPAQCASSNVGYTPTSEDDDLQT